MADEDLYAVLGVERTATEDDIRRAYRKLARKHHPDVNPNDPGAEDRFKKLSAAYDVLSKPEKRALYDEFGADAAKIGYDPERAEEYRRWRHQAQASAGFGGRRGFDPQGYVDLEDIFGDFFGQRQPRRGADVEATLKIPFVMAARGGQTSIEVPRAKADGTVEHARIALTIPEGVGDGQRLRLAGQGRPGQAGPGDLIVHIEVEDHPFFRRHGNDLELTLPVTVPEVMLGASVEVPTLDGSVRLKIPPRSQDGRRLRVRGKGAAGGDLYVVLDVVAPTGGDDEARARIARELEALYDQDVRGELLRRAS
jgi:DnaJ-class molecular chaperone